MAAAHRLMRSRLIENAVFGPERIIKDRHNPLENLRAREVFRRYRFQPLTIMLLVGILEDVLLHKSLRNLPLPPLMQVCCFLRYLATGSFQLVIADTLLVSQSTVSRVVRRLGRLLAARVDEYVKFPSDEVEKNDQKLRFQSVAGFPNVIGCVDGTQIRIKKPKDQEFDYVNRKGWHSLNVQVICDADFVITNIVAKWPGATHDARIWRECALKQEFDNGRHNGFLLADSGYACKPYMITPFLNPANPTEERFNVSLCRTRVLIEQTFGILKKRFAILHFGIRSTPTVAIQLISSCAILHNFGITHGDIVDRDFDIVDNNDDLDIIAVDRVNETGNLVRQQIVNSFFS